LKFKVGKEEVRTNVSDVFLFITSNREAAKLSFFLCSSSDAGLE
jgi:hypothetical protein